MSEHLKAILGSSTAPALWVSTGCRVRVCLDMREVLSLLWQQCPQGRCPLAQTIIGCWHRVASDTPAVGGPFSLYIRQPDFQPLSSAKAPLPSPSSSQGLGPAALPLPVPLLCQLHQLHVVILPKLQALPLFLLNSVLAFLDPSSSSLGAFGILILPSNVSADPLSLLTDGDLIIVPSTPSSNSLRNGLEQAEQCRPLRLSLWTGIYCRSLKARGKLRPIFPCLEMCFGQLNRPGE